MAASVSTVGAVDSVSGASGGSRAAELRAAKMQMKAMQQQQQQQQEGGEDPSTASAMGPGPSPFGEAPKGYIPGSGRGAGSKKDDDDAGPTGYDTFGGYNDKLFDATTPYDDDDEEADRIYGEIDDRMSGIKRRRGQKDRTSGGGDGGEDDGAGGGAKIGDQFRQLKEKLADVTEDQWASIPDVGDYSLRYKQKRREDVFTPLTDSLLEARNKINIDATSSSMTLAGTAQVMGDEPNGDGVKSTAPGGFRSVSNMSGLAEVRGTVLGMSLDKMSDSVSGQTVVDPKGYLTSLSKTQIATSAEIGDINKARLLLKSVRDTNPKHGPGWIAAARVEEAAGKTLQARRLIQDGCEACPGSEDVWLEAARLHPAGVAKTILATAVRRIPTSVKIFLRAAELEGPGSSSRKTVLKKALEANPESVTLWKAAIELEDADDAKVLLSVAVEKVPRSVEMWLALARLETYENARKVLNRAGRTLPAERSVWIAAAKLEESQNHHDMVDKIIDKAVKSLAKHDAVVSRVQWLKEAEASENAGAPVTSGSIVKHTVGIGVDVEDRQRTWADDASGSLSRGNVATARAILAHSLAVFPSKRSLWMQAVELERKFGNPSSLDEVLAAASERLPQQEIFWLVRAKEKWIAGEIDSAREILTQAFVANPNSEPVQLAAAKLEWETGEIERARVLLLRARDRASSDRVYMKSALLERQCKRFNDALNLVEKGISKYPRFEKLYMMGGQICAEDLDRGKHNLNRARKFYQRGLQNCPNNIMLWILLCRLEQKTTVNGKKSVGFTKARSLLELARLKNPKNPELWIEAIKLERKASNEKLAVTLMARALQECPLSGLLLAENISTAPRVEQKSKSADAIKKCPDDPHVIAAVASLFASERKQQKARKWFERTLVLNPDLGDSWAKYFAFENELGTNETLKKVKERCVNAEPKHGEVWCQVAKDMENRQKSVAEILELVSQKFLTLN